MGKKTDTSKPVATPAPATKAASTKPAATKKPAAKKPVVKSPATKAKKATITKVAVEKAIVAKVTFTQDDISLRAYFIAEKRQKAGLPGDSHHDWIEAERQLLAEGKKRPSAK